MALTSAEHARAHREQQRRRAAWWREWRAGVRGRAAGDGAPPWERWSPDAAGRRRLRTWRRPHRLWVDVDLGGATVPDAMANRVLGELAAAAVVGRGHTVALATTDPLRLVHHANLALLARGLDPLAPQALPAHLWVGVVAADPVAFAGDAVVLGAIPATTKFVVLTSPAVTGHALGRWLGAGPIGRVLVERALGTALPQWLEGVGAACAAAGATLEQVETPPWPAGHRVP